MRNILIAFFLGVALTATAFVLVRSETESPLLTEQVEQSAQEVATAGRSMPIREPGPEVTPASEGESAEAGAELIADEVAPLTVPIPIVKPPTPVLVMSDGTEIQTGAVTEVHSEIEYEPIDPGWASITESELYGFYAQSAALVAEFDPPSVECRSTLCLIQAVSDNPQARGSWGREMRNLFEQPWGSQFGRGPVAAEYYLTPEGQAAVLWYLKKEDAGNSRPKSALAVRVPPFGHAGP